MLLDLTQSAHWNCVHHGFGELPSGIKSAKCPLQKDNEKVAVINSSFWSATAVSPLFQWGQVELH